ncbi:uncharacterized protein LOC116211546 [Punica granatum]|uniref:Uncharacterized protein n=2 Tax=Punica granatum TaxID=22663 RepID=A0A218XBH1_PUNGR|nr:uncharacterized protein LOC116211546 [Punica granatum]OWM66108.1 hypothetical protein CDL15_Pgr015535 [Punica granatum]OWM81702.1 hypothetical protein CDL15_Pgr007740 [Punica granatum]PKI34548.1 hypothetical protein CRG98_045085 [Punica granatum]
MISLRTFSPKSHALFLYNKTAPSPKKTGNSLLCFCKSDDSSEDSSSQPEGDTRKQELLARIAMLQTQKVRLTDYLDERSDYLTKFAEEASAEFDKVGEDALKDLDEAGNRIMENIESRMQAFEESAELNRLEIEEKESKLSDFEGQIEEGRNEGLFFKSLRQKAPAVDKAKLAKEEIKKIDGVTKETAGSRTRRTIYLGLIGVLAIAIADILFISSSPDWRKVAVLGAILVGLLTQFGYEQGMSSETRRTENNGKSVSEEEDK